VCPERKSTRGFPLDQKTRKDSKFSTLTVVPIIQGNTAVNNQKIVFHDLKYGGVLMKNKFSIAMTVGVILAILLSSLALADNIQNDVIAGGNDTITVGGSATVNYRITANNGDGQTGCNAGDATPATVTINSPANVTASPGSLSFTSCGTDKPVTFTASVAGSYEITVSVSDGGTGTYNTNPAKFTLHVNAAPPPSDTTPPVITPSVVGTLGENGWYVTDVTVSWTVEDGESSISSSSGCGSTTINTDTTGITLTCTATSAGGTTSNSVTIKRDATVPTGVTGAPNRAPDSGTWYNHAVGIDFSGTDTTSGIASCTSTNYSGPDGAGVTVNGSCTDNAGNVGNGGSSSFDYDASGPTGVSLSVTIGTPGSNDWYTSNVTVSTNGSDDVSGVTCTGDQFQTSETSGQVFNGSCINGAGLTTNAAPLTVKLDKTGPSASLSASGTLGNNGWYTSDVTISTNGSDTISNPTTCTANQSQTMDTASATFNGSCTNDAGLTTNAASLTIKRDATAPTSVSFVGGPAAGGNYYFGSVPAAPSCTADGAISGLASCAVTGYSTAVGSHMMTATATDNAGNQATATQSYTVLAWTLNGFYQPVDMNNVVNTVRGGSTVPLKFEVFAGSTELTAISVVESFVQTRIACDTSATIDEIEVTSTGGTSLRYDTTGGQFIQNWQTPRAAGSCYRVTMTTDDGSSLVAFFKLK
jgi:hypothetical protein